jgi:hypothetical protein
MGLVKMQGDQITLESFTLEPHSSILCNVSHVYHELVMAKYIDQGVHICETLCLMLDVKGNILYKLNKLLGRTSDDG